MNCPECDASIAIPDDPLDGEVISCPDCGSAYELHHESTGTFLLQPAQVEGEDWGE